MNSFLIVGLGNPGKEYGHTRHNIGFRVLDELAQKYRVSEVKKKKKALYSFFEKEGKTIFLLWPQTYMNLSGDAVKKWVRFLKVPKDHILVVVDDADLPFGTLRLRQKGSSAGHNGLEDIERALGSKDYARLKWGIGRPKQRALADFVLENFTEEEEGQIPNLAEKAIREMEKWLEIYS